MSCNFITTIIKAAIIIAIMSYHWQKRDYKSTLNTRIDKFQVAEYKNNQNNNNNNHNNNNKQSQQQQ